MNTLEHVVYKLRNAQIARYPFPHFHAKEVFDWPFYNDLTANLPANEEYSGSLDGYGDRTFAKSGERLQFMKTQYFLRSVLDIFQQDAEQHYREHYSDGSHMELWADVRLIRDRSGYEIGPHTDAPWKLVSLLFYLPTGMDDSDLGTSIYVPSDHKLKCPGGPHYARTGFEQVYTAPFLPNSCFGFWKTDYSWHGVERIERENVQRDVLLYNIYDKRILTKERGNGTA